MKIVVLIDVVGANDIGVIECGDSAGFEIKAFESGRILGHAGRQHFDRSPPGACTCVRRDKQQMLIPPEPMQLEHAIFANDKTPPFTLEKLLGLKACKHTLANEQGGQPFGVGRHGAGGLSQRGIEPLFVGDATLLNEGEKLFPSFGLHEAALRGGTNALQNH